MISLDKCSGNCNVLSPEICIPKKKKDVNVKVFNMITNKNEGKTMVTGKTVIVSDEIMSVMDIISKKWQIL